MDELDSAIIKHLQLNARQSNRELATTIGVAPSTCLERVRSLQRRAVILGYRAEINLSALDRGFQAFVAAQVRPLSRAVIESFKAAVSDLPEVLEVYVIAGGDDFLVRVAVRDSKALHAFLMDRLSQRREIVSFRTLVIFESASTPTVSVLADAEQSASAPLPRGASRRRS
jgi:DNA-binding Lrp family transcriptional regulator